MRMSRGDRMKDGIMRESVCAVRHIFITHAVHIFIRRWIDGGITLGVLKSICGELKMLMP